MEEDFELRFTSTTGNGGPRDSAPTGNAPADAGPAVTGLTGEVLSDTLAVSDQLRGILATVFSGALGTPDAHTAAEFVRLAEDVRRLADTLIIGAATVVDSSDAHLTHRYRDAAGLLATCARIDRTTARHRLTLATRVAPRFSLQGEVLPADEPEIAEALCTGDVTLRAAGIIHDTLHQASDFTTTEQADAIRGVLLQHAARQDDAFLRHLAARTLAHVDPDGAKPDSKEHLAKVGITFGRITRELIPVRGHVTAEQYEIIAPVLNAFTNPRLQTPGRDCDDIDGTATHPCQAEHEAGTACDCEHLDAPAPHGRAKGTVRFTPDTDTEADRGEIVVELDGKSRPALLLDGLVAICELAARTGKLPTNGGIKPTVIVTVPLETLRTGLGAAHGTYTGPLGARTARRLACDAHIIPAILDSHSAPLDIGYEKRLFDARLRTALIARDGGCAFPDCDIPAPWCEGHHIQHWADGGPTNLDNGVLLCARHHTLIHQPGWSIRMIDRIPHFVPPRILDPHQVPRRNRFHRPPSPFTGMSSVATGPRHAAPRRE